jgi:hypothetical protein
MTASGAEHLGPSWFCTVFPYECSRSKKQVFPEEININTLYYKVKKDILNYVIKALTNNFTKTIRFKN